MSAQIPDNLTPQQEAQVIANVQQQVQAAALQELMQKVTSTCFKKCVTNPSSKLGSSEQSCIARCQDRYIDVMGAVSQAMMSRGNQ